MVIIESGVQTVNVEKDQHNTDNPQPSEKDTVNIIKYVDENGNVVKTERVVGKLGDPITVVLPAGYHFKDGKIPQLVISKETVQIVDIVKDQATPDTPTIDDNNNKKNNNTSTDTKPVTPNANTQVENGGASSENTGNTNEISSQSGSEAKNKQASANELPQTGNETHRGLSAAGLALASLVGLFGLTGFKKKRDN